uniref:Tify domain-containing protein n=1 Tax=Ananas comosus var. bracteatus TaxID=296719 RepID=A0A6V7QEN4_ANACO|nr:unnamed protein product [Ananas comosus var. bracteatus]
MVIGEPELCLRLGIGDDRPSGDAHSAKVCRDARCFEIKEKCQEKQKQQQNKQITIFYKGQICVCDITEIQARAIITMADQAMGNTANKNGKHTSIDTNNHYKHTRVVENSCNTSPRRELCIRSLRTVAT